MKITLDKNEIESLPVHENTIILLTRLIEGVETEYFFSLQNAMFNFLKIFSKTYSENKSKESQFCYEHLLYTLHKLYPKEFQKELLKCK